MRHSRELRRAPPPTPHKTYRNIGPKFSTPTSSFPSPLFSASFKAAFCCAIVPYFRSNLLFSHARNVLKRIDRKQNKNMNAAHTAWPLTYCGPSDDGYIRVPSNGPHWPMTLRMTIPAPRRVSEPWLFVTQGRMLPVPSQYHCQIHGWRMMDIPIAGKMPAAARKTPKYLAPTEWEAAKIT